MDDEQLLLIDSDLFIVLSGSRLLDRVVELLGFSMEQVRRLEPLPHMLKKNRSMQKKYPDKLRQHVLTDCDRVAGTAEAPADADVLNRLIQVDSIDDGEALLYAMVHERKCCLLGSGDKRAMAAVAQTGTVADVRDGIAGRVVSLEVVCEVLLHADDVTDIAVAFAPVCNVNQTLAILFGSGGPYTKQDRLDAVASYRKDLERTVGEDFLYRIEGD